jgi:3-deoxy-D-manno-octulosonic-acid transferase
VTTTTQTGQSVARNNLPDDVTVFYLPLDWKWLCRRALLAVCPDAVLLVETEIWPNFISVCSQLKIPVILVNGRISDRSFANYSRFSFFVRPILSQISHFCMQSKLDKSRIIALGAPEKRVNWVGNLKYDYKLVSDPDKEQLKEFVVRLLRAQPETSIWLCGSTKPGEEELLLSVFSVLKKEDLSLKLILAPRHPHRGEEIAKMAGAEDFRVLQRSKADLSVPQQGCDVLVLDSIGELAHLYETADVVFVGGSLVPAGGQNIIEAAAASRPILFGPHMENFRAIAASFVENYAALQVQSPKELEDRLRDLLKDKDARNWLGQNARKVIRDNQGAVERTADIVQHLVQQQESSE